MHKICFLDKERDEDRDCSGTVYLTYSATTHGRRPSAMLVHLQDFPAISVVLYSR